MSRTWFTADCHFGHARCIEYSHRPFSKVEEMDEALIQNWNDRVQQDDVVWVLGDFCISRNVQVIEKYVSRLKGHLCITLGDHDAYANIMDQAGFVRVRDLVHFKDRSLGRTSIVLCHWPFAIWRKSHYNSWCLHGHCHGRYQGKGKIYDVGVDANEFKPISLEQVIAIMNDKDDNDNFVGEKKENIDRRYTH